MEERPDDRIPRPARFEIYETPTRPQNPEYLSKGMDEGLSTPVDVPRREGDGGKIEASVNRNPRDDSTGPPFPPFRYRDLSSKHLPAVPRCGRPACATADRVRMSAHGSRSRTARGSRSISFQAPCSNLIPLPLVIHSITSRNDDGRVIHPGRPCGSRRAGPAAG